MQKGTQLLLVFLLSAIVAVGAATLVGVHIGGDGEKGRRLGAPAPGARTGAEPTTQGAVAAGHLREAQDEYLKLLLYHPGNAAAMRGLVAVRRQLAGDDPVVLRRQAIAYRQMAASGVEPPEHYSRKSMELLAAASLQAAAAVESEQRNAEQRANGPAAHEKGAFSPPTLPAAPGLNDKGPSPGSGPAQPGPPKSPGPSSPGKPPEVPPAQAGAPPPPPKAPAQAPTVSAPETPPAPPTGSAPPEQPAAEPTTPPAGSSEGTVAVVPPTSGGPAPAQSEGTLARVDCQKKTFALNDANGDQEYLAAPTFTIYVRGVGSERLADFCGLQRHLGRTAMVWWVPDGDRKIAKSMSVVLPSQ